MGTKACLAREGENKQASLQKAGCGVCPAIRWCFFSARMECCIAFYAISVLMMWLLWHYCVLPQFLHTVFVSVTLLLCFYFLQIWATQLQCNLQWMARKEIEHLVLSYDQNQMKSMWMGSYFSPFTFS